ncbi:MAG: hypothetical protein WAX69_04880 [Victivallales bacterium]
MNGIDPSGKFTVVEVFAVLAVITVAFLVVAVLLNWKERAKYDLIASSAIRLGNHLNAATGGTSDSLNYNWGSAINSMSSVIDLIIGYNLNNDNNLNLMQSYKRHLNSGEFEVYLCSPQGSIQLDNMKTGAFRKDNRAYISRSSIPLQPLPDSFDEARAGNVIPFSNDHLLRLTLIAFAEYQHTNLHPGGSFGENKAQTEFEQVRNSIPNLEGHVDYDNIMKIDHGNR